MSKIGKFLLFMAIVIGGFFLGYWLASSGLLTHLAGISLLDIAAIIWVLACSFLLQIVLHEAGHVLAGWLVGMDLILFRLGSHVWYRSPEGWQHGREYVDGIGGQALMVPGQSSRPGSRPAYVLYLLGGVAMNFILGALLIVWACTSSQPWNLGLLIGGGSAWLLGLVNLFPTIPYSDGAHVWQLLKNPKAPSELFRAMKLQEQLNQGTPTINWRLTILLHCHLVAITSSIPVMPW
ncbi:zinc metalloprotease [Aerococcus mictus]